MQFIDPFPSKDSGFGLLATVASMAILSILVATTSRMLANEHAVHAVSALRVDARQMSRLVRAKFDCAKTVENTATSSCPGEISLYNRKGNVVITDQGDVTKDYIGKYRVRAKCVPKGSNEWVVRVDFRKETSAGSNTPAKHPITKQPFDWENLFAAVPLGCTVIGSQ